MTLKKPFVVVTRRLPKIVEERMKELFDVTLNIQDIPYSTSQLKSVIKKCDVLVPTLTDKLDYNLLSSSQNAVKLIANFGNGTDHIDIAAAHTAGVVVTNTPDVLTNDTADIAMALIISVPRRLVEGARMVDKNQFAEWKSTHMLGGRLSGKSLGIVGMGRIGFAVAKRAHSFGIKIHYHNRRRLMSDIEEEVEAKYWDSLDDMLSKMDIISIHCPYNHDTNNLISERRMNLLKEGAYIINVSRAGIIDERILISLLEDGKIAGAGLDVFDHYPAVNIRLKKLKNVILLPHMSSATLESRIEMGEKVIINIKTFIDGHRPPNRVISA
mgnify:CR=1 FL=1